MPYGNLLADVVQGSTANTPPVFKDGNSTEIGTLCRAWVNFNGTGTVAIRASFNVSSITDNGTGDYTVNFTNAMPDTNYSVVSIADNIASNAASTIMMINSAGTPYQTTSVKLLGKASNGAGTYDAAFINVAIFR
jgi:hypothetical protein